MQMPSPIGPAASGITKVHGPHGINAPHAPFRARLRAARRRRKRSATA